MHRAALAAALLALACSAPDEPRTDELGAGHIASSLALDGDALLVVDADQARVSWVDPATLELRATLSVGAEPRSVLLPRRAPSLALVTLHGEDGIAVVDRAERRVVDTLRGCDGAFGLAESADGARVVASCEWAGSVVAVDVEARALRVIVDELARPRSVAVLDDAIAVGEATSGVRVLKDGASTALPLVPVSAPYRPALSVTTPSQVAALAVVGRRLVVAHQLVNSTGTPDGEPKRRDYGSLIAGQPRITPALSSFVRERGAWRSSDEPVSYAVFDGGERALSGPSALLALDDDRVAVAHLSSARVAIVKLAEPRPEARIERVIDTGSGPRGLALAADGGALYVDAWLDGATARASLGDGQNLQQRRSGALPDDPRVVSGRRTFFDATNEHLTPSGVVACATCHLDGGDDGLTWLLETDAIPAKRRRTPHLASSGPTTHPLHWDGALRDMPTLVQATVVGLMAGDGLLVDGALVDAYVGTLQPPRRQPREGADLARGEALFRGTELGCAGCHEGADLTDNQRHALLDGNPTADPAPLDAVDTPGLRGVFARAPYFHDGRSPTLEDALTRDDARRHASLGELSDADRRALLDFVESL